MQFSYKARDKNGAVTEGVLNAADRFSVSRELRNRELTAMSVTPIGEVHEHSAHKLFAVLFAHITAREKIVFVNNLSGMLTAGLTLYRALEVERKQTRNPALQTVIDGLLSAVNGGEAFSDALAKYPDTFSPLFVSMVHAGEESGTLPKTLKEIGDNLEKAHALANKIKGALMYPLVIVIAIVVVAILMLMFVVPTLTKIFNDLGTKLPPTTRFVVAVSNVVSGHPIVFLGALILVAGTVTALIKSKKMRRTNDAVILRIPIVGEIVKQVNTARTARTLSSLLASGIQMTEALSITQDILQNVYYKAVLERAGVAVQKGETLSSVFRAETKLYPIAVSEMIAVGEETGSLAHMLTDIAAFYEDEVDTKTKNLSTIIEPVVMVLVGAAVGFFAVSMISPMYSLLNSIS